MNGKRKDQARVQPSKLSPNASGRAGLTHNTSQKFTSTLTELRQLGSMMKPMTMRR